MILVATTATVLYFILTTTRLHWTGSLKFFELNRFRWIRGGGWWLRGPTFLDRLLRCTPEEKGDTEMA